MTHESAPWLRGFVDSWNQTVAAAGLRSTAIEFFAVDAGSADDSSALLQTLKPDVQLLRCENLGYGSAINRAAAKATAEWLLICNPDVTFPRDFLTSFLQLPLLQSSTVSGQIGCIAPRLTNADGSAQPSVGHFPTIRALLRDQFRPRSLRKYQSPQPFAACAVDWASGACLFLRRSAFEAAGGFDERYFLYMEEVDLQRRLRDAGHPTLFAPALTVTHHHPNAQRSPRLQVQRYSARGLLRYFAKHSAHSLLVYRLLALVTGRLSSKEALAPRKTILNRATGP